MVQLSENRFSEYEIKAKKQIKAIHSVYLVIKAATTKMDYESFYVATHGSISDMKLNDESNFQKGIIALKKARRFYIWIIDNHLPLACNIAPEVFDPSLMTRWKDFVHTHGVYGKLTFELLKGLNLTGRSRGQHIADQPIPMMHDYVFNLDCDLEGTLLPLENCKGKIYPFSLCEDEITVPIVIKSGKQTLPSMDFALFNPLSEEDDDGFRCYYLLIASPEIINEISKDLIAGEKIKLDKLDQIAFAFKDIDASKFQLHRLNVVFKWMSKT